MRDNIYRGIIFWIDKKKNRISQFKNSEIDGIQRWKGGIPSFKFKAIINKILKKLNWKKIIILYNKEKIIKREAKAWIMK